ncbi:sulfatase [Verrucomicrobia bacterium]|jgi:arylsulfatase A-like enzyme|nr:sulfatase [Verrucomicrobiota bacterium]
MKRTFAAVSALLGVALTFEIQATERRSAGRDASTPNVLMIIVDDMNDWVGCLGGHPDVKTPNIDRLAKRGMLFANAHVPSPVCNPSRVAVMTGRLPSSTGVYDNKPIWHEWLPEVASLPAHFKANGYHVLGGGKVYHHMPGFNRSSDWHEYFDQRFDGHYQDQLSRGIDVSHFQWPEPFPLNKLPSVKALAKPPKNPREFDWGPLDKSDHETGDGRLVDWAVRFLAQPPKAPFFLVAGIYRPHLPFYAPRKYFDMYPRETIALPLLKEDDLEDLPPSGKQMAANRADDYHLVKRSGKYREILQAYLASITFADAMVGRLLDALDSGSAADNTIIVFWSDHGWHLGEKQHLHKFTLWERSTRIPLIVSAPGVTATGRRSGKPVGAIDLFPTLSELCGLTDVVGLDGQSLVPLLQNPGTEWERPALTTYGHGNYALRSERWRYIRYANGDEELYDHANDSNEWNNRASVLEYDSVKSALARWLPKNDAETLKRKRPSR